jgi:hypothetical protein
MNKYYSIDKYNYTSLSGKKYYVNENELSSFFKEYLNSNERDITEKHLDNISKLIIDIDLKNNDSNRQITEQDIKNIIIHINSLLNQLFNNPNKLVYVMQRIKPYKKDNYYKDGLHIIYPNIISCYEVLFILRKGTMISLKWLEKGKIIIYK